MTSNKPPHKAGHASPLSDIIQDTLRPHVATHTQALHRLRWADRIDVYFGWGVPGRLDESRLVGAARLLLLSFPALGSRLDLTSVPALRLQDAAFPVSFAEWPSGSADQLFGLEALPPLPTPPLFDAIKVLSRGLDHTLTIDRHACAHCTSRQTFLSRIGCTAHDHCWACSC